MDPFLPSGGKGLLKQHKPATSYFDEVTYSTIDHPGPGKYTPNLPADRVDFSQAVFSHTTETMAESKKLVQRVTGGASEVPGPGAYSLPELPSIHGTGPKMLGRQLPFAVPKPYRRGESERTVVKDSVTRNCIASKRRPSPAPQVQLQRFPRLLAEIRGHPSTPQTNPQVKLWRPNFREEFQGWQRLHQELPIA